MPTDSGFIDYVWEQIGDPHSGTFSLTQTGGDRYDLLEAFKDVSNTQAGQTPGHMNVYPVGQTFVDPIYLITGANSDNNRVNRSVHQDIAVDTWERVDGQWLRTGRRYFSFGACGFGVHIGGTWLGFDSVTCCLATGRVFEASRVENAGTVVNQLDTTPEQDNDLAARLSRWVGTTNGYSVARHNCRAFSQGWFDWAKEVYGR